ncbi:hypothetical protein QJS04_geneDACA008782 [Acorus gramineus]|uniref:Uncharacterized protein n=1 Tax=Acorus gramineus TaxID=55184 RepID=A0AAV9AD49_ACOGR|nr:hypothetical protein QJS04_geneDACA008782 [Acorus gramineus]
MDGTVDRHGHPAIKRKSGGWLIGSLLLGVCARLRSQALSVSLSLYIYHLIYLF